MHPAKQVLWQHPQMLLFRDHCLKQDKNFRNPEESIKSSLIYLNFELLKLYHNAWHS